MDRIQFLEELFNFFGKVDTQLMRIYDMALTTDYNVDWYKLYKYIIFNVDKRILPLPKAIKELLPKFKIYEGTKSEDINAVVRIYTTDNKVYDCIMADFEKTSSISDIIGNPKVKKVVKYPAGTTLLGDKYFFKIFIPYGLPIEEQNKIYNKRAIEMEKEIKILYESF